MHNDLPQSVKACLWSYNTDKIDLAFPDHRKIIIHNVLERGTSEAVEWLMQHFDRDEIAATITASRESEWSKKSLSLWSLIFRAHPAKVGRFE